MNEKKTTRNVFDEINQHKVSFPQLELNSVNVAPIPACTDESHLKNPPPGWDFEPGDYAIAINPLLPPVDCNQLVVGGNEEAVNEGRLTNLQLHSKSFEKQRQQIYDPETLLAKMSSCSDFIQERRYFSKPLSQEEAAYPIAYIITIHKSILMFERLLRSIYHPQNLHCIHVDEKSPDEFKASVKKIVDCLDNVFLVSKPVSVVYTHWSRVQADLNCMADLVDKHKLVPWKYVINLCGQDFPLKTNFDIVRQLKALNGFNSIETILAPGHKKGRYEYHFEVPTGTDNQYAVMKRTDTKKEPSPLDIPMFAGSAYYIWRYEAVHFFLTDSKVQQFLRWNEDTYSPDEHMWATLQRWYPNVPGSYPPHSKYDQNELLTIVRLVKWYGLDKEVYPQCGGHIQRGVCVYGVGDLSWLLLQHHIFANKFDDTTNIYAVECLDVWVRNKTLEQKTWYDKVGFL